MQPLYDALNHVRKAMDQFVVGHEDIKEAILLALTAREHVYIEGPPGSAKTMLAEIAANSANMRFFFYQLHRDTRLPELLGDYVIHRSQHNGGEQIRQEIVRGGILTSDICVLDDISRAPGEALNVLLRVLNERKYGRERIQLLTAIATGNPARDDYYNEPLDLANLDRFTLQLRTHSLLENLRWDDARAVIDAYQDHDFTDDDVEPMEATVLTLYPDRLAKITFPNSVRDQLLLLMANIMTNFDLNENNSLVTDRTFLVKAVKVFKSKAILEGRDTVISDDLHVLKYLTTFRLPPEVHEQIDDLIDEVTEKKTVDEDLDDDSEPTDQQEQADGPPEEAPQEQRAQPAEETDEEQSPYRKEVQYAQIEQDQSDRAVLHEDNRERIDDLDVILKVIEGEVQRSLASRQETPGGSPKQWQNMRRLDDFFDTDVGEASVWLDSVQPRLPRVFRRTRLERGGRLVVIRDISQSMTGKSSVWVSMVVVGLVEMAKRRRMAVGYVEFNHQSFKFLDDGRFFTTNYDTLMARSMDCQCSGFTDYQNALSDALAEFASLRGGRQHIVFLTDGMPTSGDKEVKTELQQAQHLGVSIHSIFIGREQCPPILRKISRETRGVHFQVMPNKEGMVKVFELLS